MSHAPRTLKDYAKRLQSCEREVPYASLPEPRAANAGDVCTCGLDALLSQERPAIDYCSTCQKPEAGWPVCVTCGGSTKPLPASSERPEVCICAALKIGELVVRGHRHDSCFHTASLIPGVTRDQIRKGVQGFVTSTNRFVGREEAMRLQVAAGRKSAYSPDGVHRGDILFSEDLY